MNRLERTRLRNELERDVLRWVTGPDVEVPSLPSVVVELNSEIVRGRKSLLALSRLVERDPLLSARLVRVARSALYGPALGELDIHQAMLRVGLEGIRDLAMALTIEHVFIAKRFARVTFESCQRSFARALCARALSAQLDLEP